MAKIMLVEDDNNLREIYEARLLAEGYEIVSAKDGEEALALAVKEKPDLIISDVMMPKISGFDMLDILRSTPETKNTKVIMMTALSQAEDKARADKLGADRYLVKSQVTLEDVAKVAHEVLNADDIPTPAAVSEPVVSITEPTPLSVAPAPQTVAAAAAPLTEPITTEPAVVLTPEPASTPTTPAFEPVTVPEPVTPSVAISEPVQTVSTSTPDEATELGQTTATEEAAIDAQINDFIAKVEPEPTPVTQPLPEAATVAVETVPVATEQVAVTPTPEVPVATVPVIDTTAPVVAGGTKVIAPIPAGPVSEAPKLDLNALLAKEAEAEAARAAGASVVNTVQTPSAPSVPSGDDPSSIAL